MTHNHTLEDIDPEYLARLMKLREGKPLTPDEVDLFAEIHPAADPALTAKLERLSEVGEEVRRLEEKRRDATEERDLLITWAMSNKVATTEVAGRAGVSVPRVYQIRDRERVRGWRR